MTASGPGNTRLVWPSSKRTRYGGSPPAPRTSTISPTRSDWPTMWPRTCNRSPTTACIRPSPSLAVHRYLYTAGRAHGVRMATTSIRRSLWPLASEMPGRSGVSANIGIAPSLRLRHHGRVSSPGVYKCPTACDPDCTASCHERHRPQYHRSHDPQDCDQLQLGRDVTPVAPPVYSRWRAEPPLPKASRIAYDKALRADQVRWWRRLVLVVRGPRR